MSYISIDLFSGCGGLSEGLIQAGFEVKFAVDNNPYAIKAYKMNHSCSHVVQGDIRQITVDSIKRILGDLPLHFLAGCPPCQGFSSIRRLNRKKNIDDQRNALILEYFRFLKGLNPYVFMMENVPGLADYYLFTYMISELKRSDYFIHYEVLNMKDFGIPQRRKRLILVGSRLGPIDVVRTTGEKATVRDIIGNIEPVSITEDPVHKIKANHGNRITKMISLLPKNGGSRTDLPAEYLLACHSRKNVGFNDVYGRLRWDDYSTTITGGCLNPSKGRFLHPEEDRCITPREAALLQSFPRHYKFPTDIAKPELALLIGNSLPPKFSYIQSKNVKEHLDKYLG